MKKDLCIVVVSWNVERLLARCLTSLDEGCRNPETGNELSWECVVVDNNSADGSVAKAQEIAEQSGGRIRVIANPDNRGFARACNQAMKETEAAFVLLFNPDAEAPAGSLYALVRNAEIVPRAGVYGPKIIYPDGSYQESVRRFPGVWDQLGILLKLHHLLPRLPMFRRYFATDLDRDAVQAVDQVMGACFLIRRELIQQIGGLDERYFIWFEEVDYCRMAKSRGWEVVYDPRVTVIHHGGQSFGQVFSLPKQRMFNESMVKYFAKWESGWRVVLLRSVRPVSLAMSGFLDIRRTPERQWMYWLAGIVALEATSLLTIFRPEARALAAVAAAFLCVLVSYRRQALGLVFLLAELMIGSKGALLQIPYGAPNAGISLRILLFSGFMVGWLASVWTRQTGGTFSVRVKGVLKEVWGDVHGRWVWFAVACTVIVAIGHGLMANPETVGADANAWGFLLLLVPVLDVARRDGARLVSHATQAGIAALLWLPLKTLSLLYIFSHGFGIASPVYLWLRRTGVGEATLVTGNLFRLFLQSQVYAMFGVFAALASYGGGVSLWRRKDGKRATLLLGVLLASCVSLVLGLSRSLWIGAMMGGVTLLFLQHGWRERFQTVQRGVIAVIVSVGVIAGVAFLPIPFVPSGSLANLFASRGSASDPAAASRWNLLPVLMQKIRGAPILGSGFGATVTYLSKDPRVLAQNPTGQYTTYAFEWGWLEFWIKLGIIGIPIMIWLLVTIVWRIVTSGELTPVSQALIAAIVALTALHVFTPYLNHPLGFGILLAAEGWSEARKQKG